MTLKSQRTRDDVLRAPSIADVARLAGVSTQTVSRVSTGAQNVSPGTRSIVLEAMERVGYTPNVAARALRRGSSRTFGVIAHQFSRTGESRTVEAVVEAARRRGYTISLVDVEQASNTDVEEAVARLQEQLIDGLIVIRHETETPDDLRIPTSMPVVVSDARFVGHHDAVGAEQFVGTTDAIDHLLDLGHATVHHIAGPPNSSPASIRLEAWRTALARRGREVPEPLAGDWTAASGYCAGVRLAATPGVTAVFAGNDEMAVGAMLALHQAGLRVPQDVSVIGFDNIPLAEFLNPPLTTVAQDFGQVGVELVDLLLEQITTRARDGAAPVRGTVSAEDTWARAEKASRLTRETRPTARRVVPATLVVRASTAPPPTAR